MAWEWDRVLVATNLAVAHPEVEAVAEEVMTKDMITVAAMVGMAHMVVEAMMMEVVTTVIMMTVAMGEVATVVVGMEMMDMVVEGATPAVVVPGVVQGVHAPMVVQVGQAEVDQVVVVAAALVVEVGVHAVVLLEEGVVEVVVVVMVALVHRSASLVVTAIKGVVAATQNQRGHTLTTTISMGSRTPSNNGVVTTATVTREISSGTKTPGRSSRGGEVILLIGSHSTYSTRFMVN